MADAGLFDQGDGNVSAVRTMRLVVTLAARSQAGLTDGCRGRDGCGGGR